MFDYRNLPNILTLARILALIPVCILVYYDQWWLRVIAFVVFTVSALTDFVDGWLARRWNVVSPLGRMLDPIADKLLVVATLLMLVAVGDLSGLHLIPVMIILLREMWVSGLREHLSQSGTVIHVSQIAKWKTTIQLIAIAVLILQVNLGWPLLWLAGLLTLWTGIDYTRGCLKVMYKKG